MPTSTRSPRPCRRRSRRRARDRIDSAIACPHPSPMAATGSLTAIERTAYRLSQNLRLGWFSAQYALSRRFTDKIALPEHLKAGMPSARALAADRQQLMARDLENIEAGYYRLPHDMIESPAAALRQSLAYFADLPNVNRRRRGAEE